MENQLETNVKLLWFLFPLKCATGAKLDKQTFTGGSNAGGGRTF